MKLLANENFPYASVKVLAQDGHDIKHIGIDFSGITDEAVMDFARKEERTIHPFDSDYGELIFRKGFRPAAGVIYLRWHQYQPDEPGKYLSQLFHSASLTYKGKLTVIDNQSIRQRKFL